MSRTIVHAVFAAAVLFAGAAFAQDEAVQERSAPESGAASSSRLVEGGATDAHGRGWRRWNRRSARNAFEVTHLVSDLPGKARRRDENLVNPWGLVVTHDRIWVVNTGSGTFTTYSRDGRILQPVGIVPPHGSGNLQGTPTALTLLPPGANFMITSGAKTGRARLLFASADGSISAWNPDVDATRAIKVASKPNGVYLGLAVVRNRDGWFVLGANFRSGRVNRYDDKFEAVTWNREFHDPSLPDGYAPYNIVNLDGTILVAYAKRDPASGHDLPGRGHGYINAYDADGKLLRRLVSGGELNSPWAMAIAPDGFGKFAGALLVGNFGDGRINAYDPRTGEFLGTLKDQRGKPIEIEGLWGLAFAPEEYRSWSRDDDDDDDDDRRGRARHATLYFTAGIEAETHGLLGTIEPVRTWARWGRDDDDDDDDDDDRDDDRRKRRGERDAAGLEPRTALAAGAAGMTATPVGGAVEFRFTAEAPTTLQLRVYDTMGRLVAEPARDLTIAGNAVTRWDGHDLSGARAASGAYFYRAVAGGTVTTGKFVLMR